MEAVETIPVAAHAGNVLVIGNSGVGKSTLINAVLGKDAAEVSWGTKGTTKELKIYPPEENKAPFCLIDTVGFEPSFIKRLQAINSIKDWSRKSSQEGGEDQRINVIWFCVDGAARKLFPDAIDALVQATAIWESVPIVTVITKSYFKRERDENVKMVEQAFESQKRKVNLRGIIPVVAEASHVDDGIIIPPLGIEELIELTSSLMPEGIQAAEKDVASFVLKRRRSLAQGVIAVSTAAGVVAGAAPAGVDAVVLGPLEMAEIKALARVYGIEDDDDAQKFIKGLVEVGTVSVAAKAAMGALKLVPGINLAASTLNAIVCGSMVAALGSGTNYVFEKIYLGEKSVLDTEWAKKVVEAKLADGFVEKVEKIIDDFANSDSGKSTADKISEAIVAVFDGGKSPKV